MSVIEELGLRASVQIDGIDRPEWDDPDGEQNGRVPTCNKYVLSEDDREYTIKCQVTHQNSWLYERPIARRRETGKRRLYIDLTIDNKEMQGMLGRPEALFRDAGEVLAGNPVYNHSDDSISLLKFKFARISTVDENTKARVERDVKLAKGLGLITVKIWRVLHDGKTWPGNPRAAPKGLKTLPEKALTLSEKALKGQAISHGTSFRSVPMDGPNLLCDPRFIDEEPWAVFNFKYRSKDALRQEMVIPYSPAASPEPEMGALEDLSPAELRRLAQERLQQLKTEKRTGVKREAASTGNDLAATRAYKVQKREGGGVTIDLTTIDLTEDD
ncbi:hypothetical protein P8C59_007300 [Phyllachora maydis]|uniref:DUF7918 domain-containing protein n=1 Tax=Phyllachora maydis TaxID=1825666 RepID=A0AAD9I991_9PEZI|nr:hypothetical protein P8C59_007300 [Phyllachora maydis]